MENKPYMDSRVTEINQLHRLFRECVLTQPEEAYHHLSKGPAYQIENYDDKNKNGDGKQRI